jgi:integrase
MKQAKRAVITKRGSRGLGCLFKRGNAYWLKYSVGGKPIRQALKDVEGNNITTKAEAEAERKRVLAPLASQDAAEAQRQIAARLQTAEQAHAKAVEEAAPVLLISDAWNIYIKTPDRSDSGPRTLSDYEGQWKRFALWMVEAHPDCKGLKDINTEIAREYAASLMTSNIGANSYNKHINTLKRVVRALAERARIERNPFDILKPKRIQGNSRRELTQTELERVFIDVEGELKLLLSLGIYTGLRLGDCATLRWAEISLERGMIQRIPNKTARRAGKPVSIPLHQSLADMLSSIREVAQGDFVFPQFAETYQTAPEKLTDEIQRHIWDCGIDCHLKGTGKQLERDKKGNPVLNEQGHTKLVQTDKRAVVAVGFHSLRHTFVSLCREAGAPLAVVESIVGHSNPAMTRHYTHTGEAASQAAIASLPCVTDANTEQDLSGWAKRHVQSLTPEQRKALKAAL